MINVRWLDTDENIIQIDYFAPVESWGEYDDAIDRCYEMARSRPGSVYLIHHAGSTPMPEGNAIHHIRRAVRLMPPNIRLIVMVVTNLYALRLLELLMKIIFSRLFRMAKSLDEAYAIIGLHSLEREARTASQMPSDGMSQSL